MNKIKTGFSRICINPNLGAPLIGQYYDRFTEGIHDNLYASAVAFVEGEKKIVIIAVDLVGIETTLQESYRDMISEACGIPKHAVIITCSHTHTGPYAGNTVGLNDIAPDPCYNEFLGRCLKDSAEYAFRDLSDSEFFYAEGETKDIAFIRRCRMKDGRVTTGPSAGSPDVVGPVRDAVETTKLVKIVRENNDDIYIVNFGIHADIIKGCLVSADFPGYLRDSVEGAIPGTKCVFWVGAQGDVAQRNVMKKGAKNIDFQLEQHSRYVGHALAGTVLQICDKAKKIEGSIMGPICVTVQVPANKENHRLAEAKHIVELHRTGRDEEIPCPSGEMERTIVIAEASRICKLADGPDEFSCGIYALSFGELAIVTMPGQPFTEIGERLCGDSPFEHTVLVILANDYGAYYPSSRAYEEGGYEVKTSAVKKGTDDILIDGALSLLKKLKGGKQDA